LPINFCTAFLLSVEDVLLWDAAHPTRAETPLSFGCGYAALWISALGDDGSVTFVKDSSRRYLGRAGADPVDIESSLGWTFEVHNQWFVAIGRSLFRVTLPTQS
jgi:hypothetical protein